MGKDPEKFEIGLWEAAETGDLSLDGAWSKLQPLPDLMEIDRHTLFRLIAEDSVRRSIDEAARPVVLGALMYSERFVVAFGAQEIRKKIRLWAAQPSPERLYPLLRRWTEVAQMPEWRDRESVDQDVIHWLEKRPNDEILKVQAHFVRVPPLADDSLSIALYEPDPIRRLLKCYKLALNMLEAREVHAFNTDANRDDSVGNPIVLVDNLCDIATNRIQVAGLRSAVMREVPGWRIIDETRPDLKPYEPGLPVPAEFQEVEIPTLTSVPERSGLLALQADLHALKSLPQHDSIAAFCSAVGQALVEHSNRSIDRDLNSLEVAVFCNPALLPSELVREALPAWMSDTASGPMIQAVVIARNPGSALQHKRSFKDWVRSLHGLNLLERMSVLVVAAQPTYDRSMRELDAGRENRLFPMLLAAVTSTVEQIEKEWNEIAPSEESDWRQGPVRGGRIEVADRLAELQIGLDQDRLLRAQALIRIALGIPTPDVVVRAIHLAVDQADKHLDAQVGRALAPDSPMITELAVLVIAERSACDPTRAREILRERFSPSLPFGHDKSKPSLRTLAAARFCCAAS